MAVLAVAGMAAGCSDSYLDLAPETTITQKDVTKTTTAAALAINGLANAMQTQWGGLQGGMQGSASGEGFINMFYGETMGQDELSGIPMAMWGTPEIILGGTAWQQENYVMNYLPWKYCYTLIQEANLIINGIDEAEGEEADRQFIKAQALTFRAHGYTKLLQFYAPRWEDSNNGNFYCVVERLDGGTGDAPLWTMNQTLDQIYKDLNEAIGLYQASKGTRDQKWHPNINVAYGILSRAALLKHDWTTAREAAANARKASDGEAGFEVMSNDTYFAGFLEDNASLIWTQATEPSDIYYFSFGAHWGVNGAYTQNWGFGAGAINLDLYNELEETDVRRQMYLTPDKSETIQAINRGWNPGKTTSEDWWNEALVNHFDAGMDVSKGPTQRKEAVDGKWGLYQVAIYYSKYYGENIFTGNYSAMNNEGYWAYYTTGSSGKVLLAKGIYGNLVTTPVGAHYKFWGQVPYGTSAYPFMRAAEMVLNEAEAAYELGDEAGAKNLLKEIQGKRIPGYTCTKSGAALRDEIRRERRIELWGEGFNFFDFKRWNIPIVRRAWVAGDPTSGNWPVELGYNTPANCNRGWSMLIPRAELQYNEGIDRNLIEPNKNPNIYNKDEKE